MIEHTLDKAHSILYVRPQSKLEQGDFVQLAKTVDPHIEERGALAGLIIETTAFPGWESLGAMASHFRFVRDHHKHIKKIGVVTDSPLGNVAEHLASHFVAAEIRHFLRGTLRPQTMGHQSPLICLGDILETLSTCETINRAKITR
jgi:hypothetical protein